MLYKKYKNIFYSSFFTLINEILYITDALAWVGGGVNSIDLVEWNMGTFKQIFLEVAEHMQKNIKN